MPEKIERTNKLVFCTFDDIVGTDLCAVFNGISSYLDPQAPLIVLKRNKVQATSQPTLIVSFGLIATRLLGTVNKNQTIIQLPSLKELVPKEENREAREFASKEIERIKGLLLEAPTQSVKVSKEELDKIKIPEVFTNKVDKIFRVEKDGQLIEASPFGPKDKNVLFLTIEEVYIATKLLELTNATEVEINEKKT